MTGFICIEIIVGNGAFARYEQMFRIQQSFQLSSKDEIHNITLHMYLFSGIQLILTELCNIKNN